MRYIYETHTHIYIYIYRFPDGAVLKNLPANTGNARDMGSIPGSGRSPGVGNGNPLQYSCLENSIDRDWLLQPMKSQRVGHN